MFLDTSVIMWKISNQAENSVFVKCLYQVGSVFIYNTVMDYGYFWFVEKSDINNGAELKIKWLSIENNVCFILYICANMKTCWFPFFKWINYPVKEECLNKRNSKISKMTETYVLTPIPSNLLNTQTVTSLQIHWLET